MRTIADLMAEWIEAKPNRTAAALARATGVPKSTISSIMRGRKASLEVAIKLGLVLPVQAILPVIIEKDPLLKAFLKFASQTFEILPQIENMKESSAQQTK